MSLPTKDKEAIKVPLIFFDTIKLRCRSITIIKVTIDATIIPMIQSPTIQFLIAEALIKIKTKMCQIFIKNSSTVIPSYDIKMADIAKFM